MKRYCPIFLDLIGKKVVIIGGGKVAERKALSLLRYNTRIKMVSPTLTVKLQEVKKRGGIRHIPRSYKEGDLKGAFLVVGATDNEEVNYAVVREAEKERCLINVVDDPELSAFIFPSMVCRGGLMIAISTSGISPALSKKIRKELEGIYGKEYKRFLEIMASIRRRVIKEIPGKEKRKEVFHALVNSDVLQLLQEGKDNKAVERVEEIISRFSG